MQPSPSAPVRLHAVFPEGPRELPPTPGTRSVHEAMDALPLGVYTGLRTFGHTRFLGLERHLERTRRSMELLGWREPLDEAAVRRALDAVVRGWPGSEELFLRLDVLAEPLPGVAPPTRLLVTSSRLGLPSPDCYALGVGVGLAPELVRETPEAKRASFVLERRPYPIGERERFEHLLLDPRGNLLEGTSSAFFALVEGRLHTAREGVLASITASFVLELARARGLAVVERPLHRDAVATAAEAFLASSTRGILPVVRIGETPVGDGRPGPQTRWLDEAYRALAEREARPAL